MHYAFDAWMQREFPTIWFERYCDDVIVHCWSQRQARYVLDSLTERLAQCGLTVHPTKTRLVYCKDKSRTGSYEHERFDFLGYTFRPRGAMNRTTGRKFVSFSPAASDEACKAIRQEIRRWRLHLRSGTDLTKLAKEINPVVQGWINYYGRYYPSELIFTLDRINHVLVRWAMRKFKRLHGRQRRAWAFLAGIGEREPMLFASWRFGVRP